jgi:hypothetical protein
MYFFIYLFCILLTQLEYISTQAATIIIICNYWQHNLRMKDMISIFLLWTFYIYVYVASFQQRGIYISHLIWNSRSYGSYNHDFLDKGLLLKQRWNHTLEGFTVGTMTWLPVSEYMFQSDKGYVPFVVITKNYWSDIV